MLDARGQLLLGIGAALVAAGLILSYAPALLIGALLLCGLLLEVRRLRAALVLHGRPWGLTVSLRSPTRAASTRALGSRSHRVGQPLMLELVADVAPPWGDIVLRPLSWHTTAGLDVAVRQLELKVRAGTTRAVEVDVASRSAAIHRVFGLRAAISDSLGLVRAEVFLPCSFEVAVLPRSLPLDPRHLAETRRNVQRAAGGTRPDRIAGQGDELRELREHQPGDAFKHIAWKASARRGRLMSRVFEHERARALYCVLDTGTTMRDGRIGGAPLDLGLDLVHSIAELAARQNLPFGLALCDGDVVERRPVLEGLKAVRACDSALLDVRRAVAERLTPMAEDGLLALVAGYLSAIEGVDLPVADGGEAWIHFRQRTVMAALARLPERERSPQLRGPEPSGRADLSILRRFCRASDIALPYRAPLPAAMRAGGLVSGIASARAARKGPFVVLIASDFRGMRGELGPLWAAAAAARGAGHRVVFIALAEDGVDDLVDLVAVADDPDTARGLARADRAAREALLAEIKDGARRAGAALVCDPEPARIAALWATGAFR